MLHEIHIQNYAVIDSLTVEFHCGLNLLTGETGSGKSILVGALGLALGGRASPDVIRTGADRATVTAVFHGMLTSSLNAAPVGSARTGNALWSEWLEQYGLGGREDSEMILRREIQSSGRSRMLVNDRPVTIAAIKELTRLLVEVHGQGEHVELFSRQAQLDLLDRFAGTVDLVEHIGHLYAQRCELEREMKGLNQNEQERLRSIDLLQFQLQELERAQVQPGEDASLEAEKRVLANLEKIRATAASAYSELYEEEGSALGRLAVVSRAIEELRRYDAHAEPFLEPLTTAKATLDDLAFFLRDYLGKLESDPRRLEEIEDRLALIDRLKRKYGSSIEEMLAYRDRTRQRLSVLERADERRAELGRELEAAAAEYQKAAQVLSAQRRAAAKTFEKLVREELAQVGMEKTRFQVRFTPPGAAGTGNESGNSKLEDWSSKPGVRQAALGGNPAAASGRVPDLDSRVPAFGGAKGIDEIEFLISPNPGEELRPLENVASGGELSRLMLALKTVVGQTRAGSLRKTPPSKLEVGPGDAAARGSSNPKSVSSSTGDHRGLNPDPKDRAPTPGPFAPTFVFDEVDAGIGGRVAESVGQRLKRLSRDAQVLCVTHLPQIACFADHHYHVEKFERGGRTLTTVTYLATQKERAAELARMLSGSHITDAVLKHAAAMLKQAATGDR